VVTVELTVLLLGLGLIIGTFLALGQTYGPPVLAVMIEGYERFFRSVPALVLLFLFYFGGSYFGFYLSPLLAAVLALGFRSSAYQSQIFRGAIQAVRQEQMLAARSIGMSRFAAIRYVVLPQALRLSITPWSNEYSSVLKDSSFAYAVGVVELVREGRYIIVRTFEPMIVYLIIAVMFLLLTYTGNRLLRALENRLAVPGCAGNQRGMKDVGI